MMEIGNIEKNVSKLLERYKKSHNLIESATAQSLLLSPAYSMQQLHQQNMESPTSQQFKTKTSRMTSQFNDDDSSREKYHNKKRGGFNSIEQVSRLKETMWLKENLERENQDRQSIMNKQLKQTLREYTERIRDLERKTQSKDTLIHQLQEENKANQDTLSKVQQYSKELKAKEEQQNKIIEEFKLSYHSQKSQATKKKAQILQYQEQAKQYDDQLNMQGQKFSSELERVQKLCEDFSQEIKNQEEKNQMLERELIQLKQALDQRDDQNQSLDQSIQEFRSREQEILIKLEGESQRAGDYKSKFEQMEIRQEQLRNEIKQTTLSKEQELHRNQQELMRITKQSEQEVEKKRNKLCQMKTQLMNSEAIKGEAQRQVDQYQKHLDHMDQELNKFNETKRDLDERDQMVGQLREKNKELSQQLTDKCKEIKHLEKKINADNQLHLQDHKKMEGLNESMFHMQEEMERMGKYVDQTQRETQSKEDQQNECMNYIEIKIDNLMKEMSALKLENLDLQNKEKDSRKQVKVMEDNAIKVQEKHKKYKQQLELIKLQNKNMEEKIRTQENEKFMAKKEINTKPIPKNEDVIFRSKLRALDDIQSMIYNHKQVLHHH